MTMALEIGGGLFLALCVLLWAIARERDEELQRNARRIRVAAPTARRGQREP